MSRPAYYLVNHTRKEFLYFYNKQSIFKVLQEVMAAFPEWKDADDVHVDTELCGSTVLIEHLTNLEYKDLQATDGCIGCNEPIEVGAQGYCAQCWRQTFDCEDDCQ